MCNHIYQQHNMTKLLKQFNTIEQRNEKQKNYVFLRSVYVYKLFTVFKKEYCHKNCNVEVCSCDFPKC